MREINLGPVLNADGSPSDLTLALMGQPALSGEVIDPEPLRCQNCRSTVEVTIDSTGGPACPMCFVPDIRDPNWAGFIGPDTDISQFEVAPPNAKVAVVWDGDIKAADEAREDAQAQIAIATHADAIRHVYVLEEGGDVPPVPFCAPCIAGLADVEFGLDSITRRDDTLHCISCDYHESEQWANCADCIEIGQDR